MALILMFRTKQFKKLSQLNTSQDTYEETSSSEKQECLNDASFQRGKAPQQSLVRRFLQPSYTENSDTILTSDHFKRSKTKDTQDLRTYRGATVSFVTKNNTFPSIATALFIPSNIWFTVTLLYDGCTFKGWKHEYIVYIKYGTKK